jgi:hypothetical protein
MLPSMREPLPYRLACFVTPHGFGHAARASAVLDALARLHPGLRPELFTTVPEWFFQDSLEISFGHHPVACDVGLVQRDALTEDLEATVDALGAFLPFDPRTVHELAAQVLELGCHAVLCDIAPLGLAVAQEAGLPSALLESFTWDWIYRSYVDLEPGLDEHARQLEPWSRRADLRLQASPICQRSLEAELVAPISRRPRRSPAEVRAELGLAARDRVILVTMGGIPWQFDGLEAVPLPKGVVAVVPGGAPAPRRIPGGLLLPHRSPVYHPDLLGACDAVVGKLGYSTVAEAWAAGLPFAYVPRPRFPESRILAAFVAAQMEGFPMPEDSFRDGAWAEQVDELLALPRCQREEINGAQQAAGFLAQMLEASGSTPGAPGAGS